MKDLHAAPGIEADLDVDGRRVLDVLPGGLNQARHLAQLGEHAARPLFFRGVGEDRLRRQAGGEDLAVHVRAPLPGAGLLELEHPGPDVAADNPVVHLLVDGEPINRNGVESARKPRQRPQVRVDGAPAEVLQQVIMKVHAIEGGVGGTDLVKIAEVVVDEMAEWFRGVHVGGHARSPPSCGHLPRLQ